MNKLMKLALPVFALLVIAGILFGVFLMTKPKAMEGEKTITVTVVHKDGSQREFSCTTQAEFLSEVLVQEEIVEDNQGEYGLFILVADGELADFNVDGGWWAVYEGDVRSDYGADQIAIRDGGTYKLVYTIGA